MGNTIYVLFCDACKWRRLVKDEKDTVDLYELKAAEVQKTIPKLDKETNKTVESTFQKQKRKFRCPECGRYVSPKMIQDVQKNIEDKAELEKRVEERRKDEENWFAGRKNSIKGPSVP